MVINITMDLDQTRIQNRINVARVKMETQVAADGIKADLCNYIRETQDPHIVKLVASMESANPLLYAYIRRLELINNSIYCTKCDNIKYVPGFNEAANSTQLETVKKMRDNCADDVKKITLRAKEVYNEFQESRKEIDAYMKNLLSDLATCRDGIQALLPPSVSSPEPSELPLPVALQQAVSQQPLVQPVAPASQPRLSGSSTVDLDSWFKQSFVEFDDGSL